jgi:hypothetical protein
MTAKASGLEAKAKASGLFTVCCEDHDGLGALLLLEQVVDCALE